MSASLRFSEIGSPVYTRPPALSVRPPVPVVIAPALSVVSRPPDAVCWSPLNTSSELPTGAFEPAVADAAEVVVLGVSVLPFFFELVVVSGALCVAGAVMTAFAPFEARSGIFHVGASAAITGTCVRTSLPWLFGAVTATVDAAGAFCSGAAVLAIIDAGAGAPPNVTTRFSPLRATSYVVLLLR